jgi:hypothetical protein
MNTKTKSLLKLTRYGVSALTGLPLGAAIEGLPSARLGELLGYILCRCQLPLSD